MEPWEAARLLAVKALEHSRVESHVIRVLRGLNICGSRAIVVAIGKAAPAMASTALDCVEPEGGVIAVPRGYPSHGVQGLEVILGGHPLPDEGSLKAGEALLEWAEQARSRKLLLALISGGGSAAAEKPLAGITLEDLREAYRLLVNSGASIDEVNTVRKHLSLVKGGRLALHAQPARVVGVYVSDVPGDRLDVIASGPTVPDPTTFTEALAVLERWGLTGEMPRSIIEAIYKGVEGLIPDTPKPGVIPEERLVNTLAAANIDVLRGIAREARELGYRSMILTSTLDGEASEVARFLAGIAVDALNRGVPIEPPAVILAGGEATVRVAGKGGIGGRNLELALAAALAAYRLAGPEARVAFASVDTDGIDGNSPAAGGYAWPALISEAIERGLKPWIYLARHDAYTILKELGTIIETGPTGSNLNSVTVAVVDSPQRGS